MIAHGGKEKYLTTYPRRTIYTFYFEIVTCATPNFWHYFNWIKHFPFLSLWWWKRKLYGQYLPCSNRPCHGTCGSVHTWIPPLWRKLTGGFFSPHLCFCFSYLPTFFSWENAHACIKVVVLHNSSGNAWGSAIKRTTTRCEQSCIRMKEPFWFSFLFIVYSDIF